MQKRRAYTWVSEGAARDSTAPVGDTKTYGKGRWRAPACNSSTHHALRDAHYNALPGQVGGAAWARRHMVLLATVTAPRLPPV